jgi:ketosteroid isomerase-like protein
MRLILCILLSLSSIFCVAQQDSKKMEVMMMMSSLRNSLLTKDSTTLMQILSNDVAYGHTNGLIQTKAQLIHDLMTGVQEYKNIEPSDMNIRVYENTAVVNINVAVKMNYQAKPLDMNMRVILVWVKKNDKWELVARQSVKY